MDNTLKIKLSIADRVYPLVIEPHQEEGFRKAAKEINEMIHNFERNYELKDKRDALAMCTIVLATQIEQAKIDESNQDLTIKEKLENISKMIDSII
ncbi:cell division protein ZapA [Capnocytophaga stomatis]|uniref:Cell division protein ZapA n=1 Tax=Capnocytophaga stomatis TaxID=1848904 RepID=A0A250FUX9_9FLAO|nr:cell division protein ZapA [Capnocytophaga stomatis]ATA88962.1 cell division protein ZapA [Capnocytophaga stomatis]GIJ94367.1 cell division protein ZapA [Capnocytophaga stomatis]GIJ95772.1 cell division protein ZapA [Capnocytophaga stomatis]GIM48848.1 cell division protein ZapA [Capnocytophaga stomatis]